MGSRNRQEGGQGSVGVDYHVERPLVGVVTLGKANRVFINGEFAGRRDGGRSVGTGAREGQIKPKG